MLAPKVIDTTELWYSTSWFELNSPRSVNVNREVSDHLQMGGSSTGIWRSVGDQKRTVRESAPVALDCDVSMADLTERNKGSLRG